MSEIGGMSGELKWDIGDEKAQLKFTELADGIRIETIVVPASCRGKDIGSNLINRVIECANPAGKDLGACPSIEDLMGKAHFGQICP